MVGGARRALQANIAWANDTSLNSVTVTVSRVWVVTRTVADRGVLEPVNLLSPGPAGIDRITGSSAGDVHAATPHTPPSRRTVSPPPAPAPTDLHRDAMLVVATGNPCGASTNTLARSPPREGSDMEERA
jgi:hypothetical protein